MGNCSETLQNCSKVAIVAGKDKYIGASYKGFG